MTKLRKSSDKGVDSISALQEYVAECFCFGYNFRKARVGEYDGKE